MVAAKSMAEVRAQVNAWQQMYARELVFRGQTSHYPLERNRPNPAMRIDGLGEISLLPSVWRTLLKTRRDSYVNFQSLHLTEWQRVINGQFDEDDIKQRIAKITSEGAWILGYQDMEDSDDPVLQQYGRLNLDLSYGMNFDLADLLSTLLQHYGLLSPYLDLTSDLDVAVFFATHRFKKLPSQYAYEFVGTNSRKSILYVLKENAREMHKHEDKRIVDDLKPLRPLRQSCVICRSAPFALNLAADFVVGVIKFDFDISGPGVSSTGYLFPSQQEDRFLTALKRGVLQPDRVTDFGAPGARTSSRTNPQT